MSLSPFDREQQRQQVLMAAVLSQPTDSSLHPWVASRPAGLQRGLQAYQANAGASAERSLAAVYPTVLALVGEESFAALARACWHAHPPERGDLAEYAAALPGFVQASSQLADVPYLADVARLEVALAACERALDAEPEPETLGLLADVDPERLRLVLMPGVQLISSRYPVVSLWRAHQPGHDMAPARAALAAQRAEHAVVWRTGWRAHADEVDAATVRWMLSLKRGDALALALVHAGEGFEFDAWLVQALQRRWVWRASADLA